MEYAAMSAMAAPLVGSAFDYYTDKASQKRQMDFQERMSSTAYQRAVKDLEAAGLNPVMALGSPAGGASGASAKSDFAGGASSALQAQAIKSQIARTNAEVRNLDFDSERKRYEAELYKMAAGGVSSAKQAASSVWDALPDAKWFEEDLYRRRPDLRK